MHFHSLIFLSILFTLSASQEAPARPVGIKYKIGAEVMTGQVNLYHIYYGDWSGASKWNPNGAGQSLIEDFARNIGKSDWYKTNQLYYFQASPNAPKEFVSDNVVFKAGIVDSYSLGRSKTRLVDGDIFQILARHLSTFNDGVPDPNGIYFILTSPDVILSGFCSVYCGWHTYRPITSVPVKFSFVGVPPNDCPCFTQKKGSPNRLVPVDAMISVYAHELVETVSDPELDAWSDDEKNSENADKCTQEFGSVRDTGSLATGTFNQIVGSKRYLLQSNFDPTTGKCSQ